MLKRERQKLYNTLALLRLNIVNTDTHVHYRKEIFVSNNVKNQPFHFIVTATLQLWLKVFKLFGSVWPKGDTSLPNAIFKQECIPVGCIPTTAVATIRCLYGGLSRLLIKLLDYNLVENSVLFNLFQNVSFIFRIPLCFLLTRPTQLIYLMYLLFPFAAVNHYCVLWKWKKETAIVTIVSDYWLIQS